MGHGGTCGKARWRYEGVDVEWGVGPRGSTDGPATCEVVGNVGALEVVAASRFLFGKRPVVPPSEVTDT